jgi:VWFA-related protein
MNRLPRDLIVLAVCAGLYQVTWAQQPVFRAKVDNVQVDVVVTDADGRIVRGLSPDDFEILERGRRQAVLGLKFVDAPVQSRAGEAVPARGILPDAATNLSRTETSRAFVLLIDDLHILEHDLVPTKEIVTEFVNAVAPDDQVAIVFVSRSDLSVNFTSDRGSLLDAADNIRDALGFGVDALGRTNTSNLTVDPRSVVRYAAATNATLLNVLRAFEGSSHSRKAVVHVTSGALLSTSPGNKTRFGSDADDVRLVFEASRRSNVPIYTIDPRGNPTPADAVRGGIGSIGSIGATEGQPPSQARTISQTIREQQNRLKEFALNTGGLAFTNQTNLPRAVRQIVADNSAYYVLWYAPSSPGEGGQFLPIDVKVTRPGVDVRARRGYVGAVATTGDADDVAGALARAVRSAVNTAALGMSVSVAALSPTKGDTLTSVTIEVMYPERVDGLPVRDELMWSVVALTPDGKAVRSVQRTASFAGSPPPGPFPIVINDLVPLPAGRFVIRVGVASRTMARAGSVQMTMEVPELDKGRLTLAGPALAISGETPAALNAAAITEMLGFQPSPRRTFAAAQSIRVAGLVSWTGAETPEIRAAIRGETGPGVVLPIRLRPTVAGRKEGVYEGLVPLMTVAPGTHVLEVIATSGTDRQIRSVPLVVSR